MSANRGAKRKKGRRHTSLTEHLRTGSRLTPPLSGLPIVPTDWAREFVPEYLWIASLRELAPANHTFKPFYAMMDAVDEFWPAEEPAYGLLSDFAVLKANGSNFLRKHADLVRELFLRPVGRLLAFYPESPASWLVSEDFIAEEGRLDPDRELPQLRRIVAELLPGDSERATEARMLPFGRVVKHGRIHVSRDSPTFELVPKYPDRLDDLGRGMVESFVRSIMSIILSNSDRYKDREWSKYFWRHNYDLTVCRPVSIQLTGSRPIEHSEFEALKQRVSESIEVVHVYLQDLPSRLSYDLYDPRRQEVLQGLFARVARFYLLIFESPQLWARDMAGIMLRCMVETAITFAYLIKSASEHEFDNFVKYGEGQDKLLMLHLQDSHPDRTSVEGRTSQALSDELGSFSAELLQIELGHWSNKDARKLAQLAGMEDFYRIVFGPTSSDVHGTWSSIKKSNLVHCGEPLHRYHRLPSVAEPPMYMHTLQAVQEVLLHCSKLAETKLGFPPGLDSLPRVFQSEASNTEEGTV
jgi:hypothetical protein